MRILLDDDESLGIDLTPIIDCVFLLLIFFLVATTFKVQEEYSVLKDIEELNIALPTSHMASGKDSRQKTVTLSVNSSGVFYIQSRPVTRSLVHQQLHAIATSQQPPHLRIDIDKSASAANLIELLDMIAYENISDYGIHTQLSEYGKKFK